MESITFRLISIFAVFSVSVLIANSRFDGDELREYLPREVASAQSLYNERDIAICAVSIYSVPNGDHSKSFPLSRPDDALSDWMALPLDGKVYAEAAFVGTLLGGNECFDREAEELFNLSSLSDYYSDVTTGFFIVLRPGGIMLHDTERELIIILAD